MSSYRPIDSKREEFRKYLEKSGAMDALTKVLVMLYDEPEKPTDALDYIKKHLGDSRPDDAELEIMKTDLEASMLRVKSLEDEVKMLKERLAQHEPEEKSLMNEDAKPESESTVHTVSSAPIEGQLEATVSADDTPAQ